MLPQTRHSDIYLTVLGIALTVVYGWGLITRPHRQMLRMGADSVAVLALRGRHRELLAVSNG